MKYIQIINIKNGSINSEIKMNDEKTEKEIQDCIDKLQMWIDNNKVRIKILDK